MFIITWTNSLGFFYQYLKLKLNATLTKKPKFLKIIMRRTYKQSCIKWIATYWHIGGVFFFTLQRQRVGVFAAGTRPYTELSQRPGIHHGVP